MRESPALKVISLLEKEGAHVIYNDPYIPTFTLAGKVYNSVPVTTDLLTGVDLVVITTDHSSYDYDLIVKQAPYVFDTRNATRNVKHYREKIELL